MAKGNAAKLQTLTDNLKVGTIENEPSGSITCYLALFVTEPEGDDSGTEADYSGYERQEITFGTPAMDGTLGKVVNTNEIEFAVVPTNSGSVAYAAIYDDEDGELLYYGALGATYVLNQGVQPTVPAGNLAVYEN